MLDNIKKTVFKKYPKTDIRWLFISAFDKKNQLVISNWVMYTDKSLEELIETLFHGLLEKYNNILYVVVDIITEISEVNNLNDIQNISIKDYGILLNTENKSWILLPDTQWIDNIQKAIKIIKEKNWLTWNAKIIKFKTDRLIVN